MTTTTTTTTTGASSTPLRPRHPAHLLASRPRSSPSVAVIGPLMWMWLLTTTVTMTTGATRKVLVDGLTRSPISIAAPSPPAFIPTSASRAGANTGAGGLFSPQSLSSPRVDAASPTPELASSSSSSPSPSNDDDDGDNPNRLLIPGAPPLRNRFYALRHGQSTANVGGIISSRPSVSTVRHGLSDLGRTQARGAGVELSRLLDRMMMADDGDGGGDGDGDGRRCEGVAIFSSDYRRARETAESVASEIKSRRSSSSSSTTSTGIAIPIPLYRDGVVLEERLRERNFGDLHGTSDSNYGKVWEVDASDPNHTEFGVESVADVVRRTTGLVREIDDVLSSSSAAAAASGDDGDGSGDAPYWACVLVAHGDVLQILQTGFRKMDPRLHRTLDHLETATLRELVLAPCAPAPSP